LDYKTPLLNGHLSIRLFQGDYQYLHASFGSTDGGSVNFNPQGRISAGLVYGIGSIQPPPPVTLACSINPASIFPGDPVSVTASAGDLDPKLNAIYSWSERASRAAEPRHPSRRERLHQAPIREG